MKIFRKRLKKYYHILRKEYNNADKFMRENFYLLENSYENAFSQAKKYKYIPHVLNFCNQLLKDGTIPSDRQIAKLIKNAGMTTQDISALPFFFCFTLIKIAGENVSTDKDIFRNAVTSLGKIQNTDFEYILKQTSEAEKILINDPAGIYTHMSEATRQKYRITVCRQAEKEGKTEKEIASEALKKAEKANRHIGFFLNFRHPDRFKGTTVLRLEAFIPLVISIVSALISGAWYIIPLVYLPLRKCISFITDIIISAVTETEALPSMDFGDTIPESEKTVIAVSTILPSENKLDKFSAHLRQLYLTSCKGNASICILADMKPSKSPFLLSDEKEIENVRKLISSLNEQYNNSFILAVRSRRYSLTEKEYIGHERKRGALISLVRLIKNENNEFSEIYGDVSRLKNAKYIMALDCDTQMPAGALTELVSIAAHPLNRPVINRKKQKVTKGYGIIVPSVHTGIKQAAISRFSALMSGNGGISAYSAAVCERNQQLFGESLFCGKGLIDVNTFRELLCDRFPEEQILSHDIPEGIIMRSAFAGNISLTDSFPSGERSYFNRQHRWIRGDLQNLTFLTDKHFSSAFTFPANRWITDNILSALTPVFALLSLFLSVLMPVSISVFTASTALLCVFLPDFISAVSGLLHGGLPLLSRLFFSSAKTEIHTRIQRAFTKIIMLPREAYTNADALIRAFFRLTVSRRHLLQWTTAEENENSRHIGISLISLAAGIICLFAGTAIHRFSGIMFLSEIPFSVFSAKIKKAPVRKISSDERETLVSYCRDMWKFFDDFCTSEYNYLIPDNIQLNSQFNIAKRTSPTNLGLMLCTFLASRDLGFIDTKEMYVRISLSLDTIGNLPVYKGNLYNWYNIETLSIMEPEFISSVDSGNFLCCLTALKEGLKEYTDELPQITELTDKINRLIDRCDFGFLYSPRRNLFHTGFDVKNNKFSDSYYDLLMSESRMAGYFAVAKGHAPVKHWQALGRPLSADGRYTGTVSWSGTMFEYFMPALFLPDIPRTLADESLNFCIYAQKKRVGKTDIPYGISESCCGEYDEESNYQYKAHGVKSLCMRPDPFSATVISPYSTFLTLPSDVHDGMNNLKKLKDLGAYGRYGFFEAVDFSHNQSPCMVRCFMSHHIGMSFLAAVNCLSDNIMQKRFMRDEEMQGCYSLLEEKIPSDAKTKKKPCIYR